MNRKTKTLINTINNLLSNDYIYILKVSKSYIINLYFNALNEDDEMDNNTFDYLDTYKNVYLITLKCNEKDFIKYSTDLIGYVVDHDSFIKPIDMGQKDNFMYLEIKKDENYGQNIQEPEISDKVRLQEELNIALKHEDFEKAAQLRDVIKKLK